MYIYLLATPEVDKATQRNPDDRSGGFMMRKLAQKVDYVMNQMVILRVVRRLTT